MIPEARRQWILDQLESDHVKSITDLAEALGVSHMTVRRDIRQLEKDGQVVAVGRGVKAASRVLIQSPFLTEMQREIGPKRAIARAASRFVTDNQCIFLDAGTTAVQLAALITTRQNLIVVTNGFSTANLLMDHPEIELFHTGGRAEHVSRSGVGPAAASFISDMNFDVAFLTCPAWDLRHGVTTYEEGQFLVKRSAMASSSRSILIADSTKYGRVGMFKVADIKAFDCVITDNRLPQPVIEAIARWDVELILVSGEANEDTSTQCLTNSPESEL